MRPERREEFTVAILCALPLEADAVEALFEETYDRFGHIYQKQPRDGNVYINGRIGQHNVVLCCMLGMGKGNAGSVASSIQVSYTVVQLALLVGICGGVPFPPGQSGIMLADIIISDTVVEFDSGRQYPDGSEPRRGVKGTIGPNREIRTLLATLKTSKTRAEFQDQVSQNLQNIQAVETRWQHPRMEHDVRTAK